MAKKYVNAYEENVKAAKTLSNMKKKVEEEIHEILVFDYEFTLGCFAHYYDLNPPKIADGFSFQGGLHLNLALENNPEIQRRCV